MAEELVEAFPEVLPAEEPEVEAQAKPQRKYDRSIVEGPLTSAVWKIAWPAVLTNLFSGVQGWVDQILVGNLIGYQANAAIGAAFQIFLLVITFVGSIFIGMSVLVCERTGRVLAPESCQPLGHPPIVTQLQNEGAASAPASSTFPPRRFPFPTGRRAHARPKTASAAGLTCQLRQARFHRVPP